MTFRTETSIVSGDIRETTFAANYKSIDMHASLQATAAELTASGDDDLDLGDVDPSSQEAFGKIVTLNSPFNIDDSLTENLYDGTVIQDDGDTIYGALKVIGSVATTTQLEIEQNGSFLTNHWGNGKNTATGILNRILVKYRTGGADIDSRNIRVIARNPSDTLVVFPITMEIGETTAAINTLADDAWSNSNSGVPLGLTTTADLDKLYDMAKSWKTLSLTNFDYPSAATLIAAKVGLQLQFSGVSVDIDSGAASTFAINTGTNKATVKSVTLAAGTKMTSISCAANTMTLLNSAVISAGVDIATGCTIIIPSPSRLTGTVTMTGGVLEIQGHSAGILSGTLDASSSIEISGASTDDEFNMTGIVFQSASVIENTSGNNIVIKLLPAQTAPTKTETSGTITFDNSITITALSPNLIDDTRVRLYNLTQTTEIDNSVVAGGSGYSHDMLLGTDYDLNDTIQIFYEYCVGISAKLEGDNSTVAITSDITFLDSQADDIVYNANAINGSAVAGLATDYLNVEVDIDDNDDVVYIEDIYAWFTFKKTEADGIRNWYGGILAEDRANYKIFTDVLDLLLDNVGAGGLVLKSRFQTDVGARLYRDDGIAIWEPLSEPAHSDSGRVFVAESSGGSSLTAAQVVDELMGRVMEDGETFAQAMRLIRAGAAGDVVQQTNGDYVIKSKDGQTPRISGSPAANNGRTITGVDAT